MVTNELLDNSYFLKYCFEDFQVFENLVLDLDETHIKSTETEFNYDYFFMRKKNITTFQAIDTIKNELNIDRNDISFAGLKDEDGITSQYISIVKGYRKRNLEFKTDDYIISLKYYKSGNIHISTDLLLGNSFRIIIRNLEYDIASVLNNLRSFDFINYYGIQRFGIPFKTKVTHLIGKELLNNNYVKAAEYVLLGGVERKKINISSAEVCRNYFSNLDPHLKSFYFNSYTSYLWNQHLNSLILSLNNNSFKREIEGHCFYYLNDEEKHVSLYKRENVAIDFKKYKFKKNEFINYIKKRFSIIQCFLKILSIGKDEFFSKKYKAEIIFTLPSGAYATVFIDQLIYKIYNTLR